MRLRQERQTDRRERERERLCDCVCVRGLLGSRELRASVGYMARPCHRNKAMYKGNTLSRNGFQICLFNIIKGPEQQKKILNMLSCWWSLLMRGIRELCFPSLTSMVNLCHFKGKQMKHPVPTRLLGVLQEEAEASEDSAHLMPPTVLPSPQGVRGLQYWVVGSPFPPPESWCRKRRINIFLNLMPYFNLIFALQSLNFLHFPFFLLFTNPIK